VSALLSRHPTSPTQELLRRWQRGEFTLLVSPALLVELTGKLIDRDIKPDLVQELLTTISRLAEWVEARPEAIDVIVAADPDDDQVWACAVTGRADYLVTYDPHFDQLAGMHRGIRITKALPFLWAVRSDRPSA
jgi:predicted nucleic acid-binding protein